MVLDTIHQCKLDKAYQDACKENTKVENNLVKATEAKDSYQGMDENQPVQKSWKKDTAAIKCTGETIESTIQATFLQYSTLHSEEANPSWEKIL